jgi:hypothetical protein
LAISNCRRCNRILKSPKAVEAGIGPVCARKEATEAEQQRNDQEDNSLPFDGDIAFKRECGKLITNVPRTIIHHSPDGYEWGYGGSGPADFAWNILAMFTDKDTAQKLHQEFKWKFIATAPHEGTTISGDAIKAWIERQQAEA